MGGSVRGQFQSHSTVDDSQKNQHPAIPNVYMRPDSRPLCREVPSMVDIAKERLDKEPSDDDGAEYCVSIVM